MQNEEEGNSEHIKARQAFLSKHLQEVFDNTESVNFIRGFWLWQDLMLVEHKLNYPSSDLCISAIKTLVDALYNNVEVQQGAVDEQTSIYIRLLLKGVRLWEKLYPAHPKLLDYKRAVCTLKLKEARSKNEIVIVINNQSKVQEDFWASIEQELKGIQQVTVVRINSPSAELREFSLANSVSTFLARVKQAREEGRAVVVMDEEDGEQITFWNFIEQDLGRIHHLTASTSIDSESSQGNVDLLTDSTHSEKKKELRCRCF